MAKPKSVFRDYIEQALITVVLALFGMTFIVQAVEVPTGSLQNTIHIGDHFFVNKFIFGKRTPWLGPLQPAREIKRGDIIVFKLPSNPKINYVKRVIGLPGDTVQINDTTVLVNGQPLPEQQAPLRRPLIGRCALQHTGPQRIGQRVFRPDRRVHDAFARAAPRDSHAAQSPPPFV